MKKWLLIGGVIGIISALIVLIKREKQYREWKMTVFGGKSLKGGDVMR